MPGQMPDVINMIPRMARLGRPQTALQPTRTVSYYPINIQVTFQYEKYIFLGILVGSSMMKIRWSQVVGILADGRREPVYLT